MNKKNRCFNLKGIENVCEYLLDKIFICLHYYLDSHGNLIPCTIEDKKNKKSKEYDIEDSNVQLSILVRKGVGGTCPYKSEAKLLDEVGVLSLLMAKSELKDFKVNKDFNVNNFNYHNIKENIK